MKDIKALPGKVLGEMIDRPGLTRKLASGLLVADKDGDTSGIRPRWFRVYSVGEGIDWIQEGQYVYVAHGRWSNGVKLSNDVKIYLLDNDECLAVQDENPIEEVVRKKYDH